MSKASTMRDAGAVQAPEREVTPGFSLVVASTPQVWPDSTVWQESRKGAACVPNEIRANGSRVE